MIPQCEPLIGKAEQKAVNDYMKSGGFLTEHKQTEKFEKQLAKFLGVRYVSLVTSGTAALTLALMACGVEGHVLVPDTTMIATANAVRLAGLEPILVDVNADGCMRMDMAYKKVGLCTNIMLYVDFNGHGEISDVKRFCKKHKLILIEDACQSFGSKYNGKYLGTFGRFGCFSLSFHKIITTGQGGFVVSHNRKDYETIERLKKSRETSWWWRCP